MRTVKLNSTSNKIEISFDYNPELINVIKEMPDRQWDKSRKVWTLPFTSFHATYVVDTLGDSGFQIDPKVYSLVTSTPKKKFVLKRDGLYDFQSEAIDFITSSNPKGRVLIADEQGLGKTIESVYWVSQQSDIHKTLIVCPASVLFKWKSEIEKWDKGKTVEVIVKSSDAIPDANYILVSYAILTRKISDLSSVQWDCFIADECHKLKSDKAQRSRAAKSIDSKYLLALSGTPLLNKPIEFYNILHMLNPSLWNSWWSFVHRYCGAKQTYWGLDTSGASNLEELSTRLKPMMIRRLKTDVLKELPDLVRTKLPVKVDSGEINTAYRNLYEFLHSGDRDSRFNSNVLTHLTLLRQAIGRAKTSYVIDLAEDLLNGNSEKKIVIYAVHKAVVIEIAKALEKFGVTAITGEVSAEERWNRQKAFQENRLPRVMIISSAGGEGIDLFRADTIIFAEREWGPAGEEQAEARLHRRGQKSSVESMYILAKGTIDESIDELIESKRDLIGQVIHGADIKLTIEEELMDKIRYGG